MQLLRFLSFTLLYAPFYSIYLAWAAPVNNTSLFANGTFRFTVPLNNTITSLGNRSPSLIERGVRFGIDKWNTASGFGNAGLAGVAIQYLPNNQFSITIELFIPGRPDLLGRVKLDSDPGDVIDLMNFPKPAHWAEKAPFSWEERPLSLEAAISILNAAEGLPPEERNPDDSFILIQKANEELARTLRVPVGRLVYTWNIYRRREGWAGMVTVDMVTRRIARSRIPFGDVGQSYRDALTGGNETITVL